MLTAIVIDSGVVVLALTDRSSRGMRIRRRLRAHLLYAPELVQLEVLSAIKGLLRAGVLSTAQAEAAQRGLATFPLRTVRHRLLLEECWNRRDQHSIYDASYAVLAVRLGAPLLTTDARLAGGAASDVTIEVV